MDREGDAQRVSDLLGRGGAHWIESLVAVPTGGMLQALLHRDGVYALIEARTSLQKRLQLEDPENLIVEPEPALLHQLKHRCRSERFTDAGDEKQGRRAGRFPALEGGQTETAGGQHPRPPAP